MKNINIPYLIKGYKIQFFTSKTAELKLSPLFFSIEEIIFDNAKFLFILDENYKHIKKLTPQNLRLKNKNLPKVIKFNNTTISISHNNNEMKFENLLIKLTRNEESFNLLVQGPINAKGIIDINKKRIIFSIDNKTLTFNF